MKVGTNGDGCIILSLRILEGEGEPCLGLGDWGISF